VGAVEVRDAILGAWKLIAYEDRDSEDEPWTKPFGERPKGIGVYDGSGFLSMQVFADPESPASYPYVAHVGTFTIRAAEPDGVGLFGVLEHRMEAASHPELLEEDPARPFRVAGDELILGDGRTWRRRFVRLFNARPAASRAL
jgi:Lipocalin-like domain